MMFNIWDSLLSYLYSTSSPYLHLQNPTLAGAYSHDEATEPDIRLCIDEHSVRIYGFPPRLDDGTSAGYLILKDPSDAEISYIMGQDWRTQLFSTARNFGFRRNKSYIRRPTRSPSNEAHHCMRMRRCGALRMTNDAHRFDHQEPEFLQQEQTKQIMGWPIDGGVLVLRLTPDGSSIESTSHTGKERVYFNLSRIRARLKEQFDMEDFCEVLREVGAVYYENIEDCAEAQRLDLLRPDCSTTIIPPLRNEFRPDMREEE